MAILPSFNPNTTAAVWTDQPTAPNLSGLPPDETGVSVQQLQTYICLSNDQFLTFQSQAGIGLFVYRMYLPATPRVSPIRGTPVLLDYVAIPDDEGDLYAILGVDHRFDGQVEILQYCVLRYAGPMVP